ncbi:hypothetical protein HD806DRAFT_541359 [Xylariaceae sp. AK1471]|nr:hypothetical protein HD806DRAFT_541359 [Xylariaceae sp. AK1471]
MNPIHTPDENPAWWDIIVNAVFNGLAIVVVGLRLYSRRLTRAGFGWDDGCILIATALVNAMLIVIGFLIDLGFGLPMRDVTPSELKKVTELGRAFRFLFLFCICFVKLSALFFYLRVFGTRTLHNNTFPTANANSDCGSQFSLSNIRSLLRSCWRFLLEPSLRLIYIYLIGVVILWSLANLIQELTVCGDDKPMCAGQRDTDLGMCVFNAVGDLLILILPLWPIWRLQMKTGAKVGLSIVFLLGTVTTIVAFLRFSSIIHTDYGGDYNSTAMKPANYAILEANLAILCMSLPMLQPLLRRACSYLMTHFVDRFSAWWMRIIANSWFTPPTATKVVSSTESSPSRNLHMSFPPAAAKERSDGYNGSETGKGNGNGSLASRVRSLWSAGSPFVGSRSSSQEEIVELASSLSSVSVAGPKPRSFHSEDDGRPFMPFAGAMGVSAMEVTTTTIIDGKK